MWVWTQSSPSSAWLNRSLECVVCRNISLRDDSIATSTETVWMRLCLGSLSEPLQLWSVQMAGWDGKLERTGAVQRFNEAEQGNQNLVFLDGIDFTWKIVARVYHLRIFTEANEEWKGIIMSFKESVLLYPVFQWFFFSGRNLVLGDWCAYYIPLQKQQGATEIRVFIAYVNSLWFIAHKTFHICTYW